MNRGPDMPDSANANTVADAAPQNAVMVSQQDALAIRTEWEVLYSVIEGIRNYVAQQDGSSGAESLCNALVTTTSRLYLALQAVLGTALAIVTLVEAVVVI